MLRGQLLWSFCSNLGYSSGCMGIVEKQNALVGVETNAIGNFWHLLIINLVEVLSKQSIYATGDGELCFRLSLKTYQNDLLK